MVHDVVAGILIRDAQVLLCHRSRAREWYPDVWDLPGGHVEAGEAPAAALGRELEEELGVVVPSLAESSMTLADDAAGIRMAVWCITDWHGEPVNRSPEEHDAIGWFRADELDALALAHPSYAAMLTDALAARG